LDPLIFTQPSLKLLKAMLVKAELIFDTDCLKRVRPVYCLHCNSQRFGVDGWMDGWTDGRMDGRMDALPAATQP